MNKVKAKVDKPEKYTNYSFKDNDEVAKKDIEQTDQQSENDSTSADNKTKQ